MTLDLTPFVSGRIEAFALLFVRLGAVLTIAPVFSSRVMPARVRVFFALALAITFLPLVPTNIHAHEAGPVGLLLMIAREVLLGLVLGLVASGVFFAIQIAGQLLGLQMGLGLSNVIDPQSDARIAVSAQFQYFLFTLVFLTLDGHHILIRVVAETLNIVPLGTFELNGATMDLISHEIGRVFEIALRVGGPVIAFLFISSVALGIVARTVPHMNIFVIGFPIKIIGGLVMMLITMPSLRIAFNELTLTMERDLLSLIRLF